MAWQVQTGQMGIVDGLVKPHHSHHALDEINKLIDWNEVAELLGEIYASKVGRRAYHPIMMFKVLLLGTWYSLSDPALESSLGRDLLFKRFCGMNLNDNIPDHSTISRFRDQLVKKDLWNKILDSINSQLERKGLIIKHGSSAIIDATVVRAAVNGPSYENRNDPPETTKDPDARWFTKKSGKNKTKSTFGYKSHTNVDDDGFVKNFVMTSANVHDSTVFEELLTGEEVAVGADSAYDSAKNRAILEDRNLKDYIMRKGHSKKPLSTEQVKRNKLIAPWRSTIERTFGGARWFSGFKRARFVGLAKNRLHHAFVFASYNIKRALGIATEIISLSMEESVCTQQTA